MDGIDSGINTVTGEFVEVHNERYYAIRNVQCMKPFFFSVVSDSDHWLFMSSTGGITAGRVSAESALFPYLPVDKIHESGPHTGSLTLIRTRKKGKIETWQPFSESSDGRWNTSRHIYKNLLGNKICFESVNHDFGMVFRYTWTTSEEYGFVRHAELLNANNSSVDVEFIDGLQNILPANTPRKVQAEASNLADAYKWTELDEATGLAIYTLYSAITDKAEPKESLKANTVFSLGLDDHKILLSSEQLERFRCGREVRQERIKRGMRGAYLISHAVQIAGNGKVCWKIVANIEENQCQVVSLRRQLLHPDSLDKTIEDSIQEGADRLARILASVDGFQVVSDEAVSLHHYANALYNALRGGVFIDQYQFFRDEFLKTLEFFDSRIAKRQKKQLVRLSVRQNISELYSIARQSGDRQTERLALEYLPITFGRRHGDPSRPWNAFEIKIRSETGHRLLAYQGNWRDIFQNWEALLWSYPEFIESVIAKFLNASTMDGHNPYRITHNGVDWEVEETNDPWSYIGYWGDHQIIYLLKLLEMSLQFHPGKLKRLLRRPIYAYANVPYKIKSFNSIKINPKNTVVYDAELAERIAERVKRIGADGKLVLDDNDEVYLVNLLEKLLVPMLAKLGNMVIEGGIWLNTQRPEWNDANNALVGHGLSMVTLYYLRRYISFFQALIINECGSIKISINVSHLLDEFAKPINELKSQLNSGSLCDEERYIYLEKLGQAVSRYRFSVYYNEKILSRAEYPIEAIKTFLTNALSLLDHTIAINQRKDGLYHAYNLIHLNERKVSFTTLYPMLEGQVAVLSSGAISPVAAVSVVEALFSSDIYRPDLKTFMLYPDRDLPGFLEKNCISHEWIKQIPIVEIMLDCEDYRLVLKDLDGHYRFNADLSNADELQSRIDLLVKDYGGQLESSRGALHVLYEKVFNHREFVGRSGTMFGFEGMGCVYWHMVAKLLLAIQENFYLAIDTNCDISTINQLRRLYYRVRSGFGFNKTPEEYGAFPTDPYSHTPKHAGAQQPGMTGQVKEEIITRFGELGVRVIDGQIVFEPALLRRCEFCSSEKLLRFLDVNNNWQEIRVPSNSLAFTWCQVPVVYKLDDQHEATLSVETASGEQCTYEQMTLPEAESKEIFCRSGHVRQLTVHIKEEMLIAK